MGFPTSLRRASEVLLLFSAGAALAACESDKPALDSGKGRELTPELFQELMEQGTLRPVDAMEDPYRSIEPERAPSVQVAWVADTAAQAASEYWSR